ncbi:Wzz/FepE/Etk N-terminal domain-containing protein [Pseudoalteromonas haloplanktis]|uniref:Wzz/FepE/Etk N-terminal domain-containing protein n=1 Tax=Pseudoalteromonas haloplanktis TaxID=228 RepID=A0ABU1BII3_PSEHA|nr:Wzz/FepE/Etk N-terminal domain-containing protein [Pseudoalteromonas haloplanktis]MDQ9094145.1 Wzz/FepE/Etk N-terminal domain-containing protein [Pseudoalteromonas haloplanktis]
MSKNTTMRESHTLMLNSEADSNDIDVREMFHVIWRGKWFLAIVIILFSIISIFYALEQPNIYKSEVLLAPAETDKNAGLSGLAGQFGGLASLAGVNIGGPSINKTQLALEVLKSRKFTTEFIQRHKILPQLMAAESWDIKKIY